MMAVSSWLTSTANLPLETYDWGTLRWLCNDKLSPGSAQTLGICEIWPGKRNPLHYHPNCEELLHLLAGRGQHRLNEELVELAAGSTLRIPANVHHNLANVGSDVLVCVICFSSGDRQTVFVEEVPDNA